MDKDTPELLPCLSDGEIMEIINECFPWQTEAKINDLLTREKSAPLIPQATYDVPSYRAERFVRAIEKRIRATSPTVPVEPTEGMVKPLVWEDADEGMCTKWRAAALGGHYELVAFEGEDGYAVNFHWGRPLSYWFIQGEPDEWGPTGPKMFPSLDAAKVAAQADYERRVLSCLTTPPSTDVEGVRALEDAILSVVAATRAYLPSDGISAHECLNRILAATDNPKINPTIARIEEQR